MKATDARTLKVGDFVTARFGGHTKVCKIIYIIWPVFQLRTSDYRGEEMTRERNYRSLVARCKPPTPRREPEWLQWPEKRANVAMEFN